MCEQFGQNIGRCCRIDLAAIDATQAASFYRRMFGWESHSAFANGGSFIRFSLRGNTVASLYQLSAAQIARGVPSHWTPYIGVGNVDESASRAGELGGSVIVNPFDVDGEARVGLIADPGGALLGLWELSA